MTRRTLFLLGVEARALPRAIAAQHEIEVLSSIHALVDQAAAGPSAGVDGAIEPPSSALLLGPAGGDVAAVCRQVRRVRGPFELPIVALVETRADLAPALDAGANDAAAAPWDDDEIAARLSRATDHARLFEQAWRDRRRAEEATRRMDDFLATVSHELRTPLTAILGWARLLAEASLPEPTHPRALAAIVRSAHTQRRLIEDLLDVSRIIAGQLRIDRARVDLAAVIEAALDAARPQAEARGVVLSASIAGDAGVVLGDAERIRQIAHNLLTNAVKFTPRGGRIDASLEAHDGVALLTVADTGIGIRPDFLPFVFDRFRQADAGTTRAHGGLGLGLAIARHLAELHGGALTAHSDGEGRGSRFVLRLPLDAERRSSPAPGGAPERAAIPDLRGVRVLVVDDEEDVRAFLVAAFRLAEAEVEVTGDALTALARVLAAPPDVLISDIGMAEQDGYALLGAVRALPAAEGGRVPAVALTAYARESDRAAATRAGFDAHVSKPVEPAEVLALVARLCGRVSA